MCGIHGDKRCLGVESIKHTIAFSHSQGKKEIADILPSTVIAVCFGSRFTLLTTSLIPPRPKGSENNKPPASTHTSTTGVFEIFVVFVIKK